MSKDITKVCADAARKYVADRNHTKLKASHAHEFVAAFFGYKSRAALLADPSFLEILNADIWVPDVPMMNQRFDSITGAPTNLPLMIHLGEALARAAKETAGFTGAIWLADSLKEYVLDNHLAELHDALDSQLSGVMAGTNAEFNSFPEIYTCEISESAAPDLEILIEGRVSGDQMEDRIYYGTEIDFDATILLTRTAGKIGYSDIDIDVKGRMAPEGLGDFAATVPLIAPEVVTAKKDAAEQAGYLAFEDGLEPADNPYTRGTDLHGIWVEGFQRSQEEDIEYYVSQEMDS